jgi:hypothetical protein
LRTSNQTAHLLKDGQVIRLIQGNTGGSLIARRALGYPVLDVRMVAKNRWRSLRGVADR